MDDNQTEILNATY